MEKICQLGDILFTKYSYFSTCWDYGHTFSTDYSKVIGSPLYCCVAEEIFKSFCHPQ